MKIISSRDKSLAPYFLLFSIIAAFYSLQSGKTIYILIAWAIAIYNVFVTVVNYIDNRDYKNSIAGHHMGNMAFEFCIKEYNSAIEDIKNGKRTDSMLKLLFLASKYKFKPAIDLLDQIPKLQDKFYNIS